MKNPLKLLLNAKDSEGFSLLEIAVVLAVLSLLSSIAIPNILKIGKDSNLSEAQTLLNSSAADCLQSKRNGKDLTSTPPDEDIISNAKLERANYKIKDKNKNCSNFQIEPYKNGQSLAGKDRFYYTLGFRFEGDKLVKIATEEAADNRQSCKSWAGVNCKFDPEEEKKWNAYDAHLSQVKAAKEACRTAANTKLSGPPKYTGKYTTWFSTADTGCKKNPPNIPSDGSCTVNGCNQISFAKDGQPLEGEAALKAALCTDWLAEKRDQEYDTLFPPFNPTKERNGNCPDNPDFWFIDGVDQGSKDNFKDQLCETWVKNREDQSPPYTNNPKSQALTTPECGDQEFWFYKGKDLKTKQEFDKQLCSDNLEEERQKGENSEKTIQGCGNKTYYFCDYKIKESERDYKECLCDDEKYNKSKEGKNGAFTTTIKGAKGCGNYWICGEDVIESEETYKSQCKKACVPNPGYCSKSRFINHETCATYRKCLEGG